MSQRRRPYIAYVLFGGGGRMCVPFSVHPSSGLLPAGHTTLTPFGESALCDILAGWMSKNVRLVLPFPKHTDLCRRWTCISRFL